MKFFIETANTALIGADVATIPYKVIEQLVWHPLTDIGIDRFLADWKKVPKKEDILPQQIVVEEK